MTEQEVKSVSLNDLRGLHFLTAVDYSDEAIKDSFGEDTMRNAISFTLDDVTYTAYEDVSDGYRSCMEDIIVSDKVLSNTFPPVQVYAMVNNCPEMDTLLFYDVNTHSVVLEVGTDNGDSYYPMFVYQFTPENMLINKDVTDKTE